MKYIFNGVTYVSDSGTLALGTAEMHVAKFQRETAIKWSNKWMSVVRGIRVHCAGRTDVGQRRRRTHVQNEECPCERSATNDGAWTQRANEEKYKFIMDMNGEGVETAVEESIGVPVSIEFIAHNTILTVRRGAYGEESNGTDAV